MTFIVRNKAEDGEYETKFNSFEEANAYLEELTGTTFQNYWDYAYGLRATLDQFERSVVVLGKEPAVIDEWGRQVSIRFENNLNPLPFVETPGYASAEF